MAIKKSVFLSDYSAEWVEVTTKKSLNNKELDGPKWSESINATYKQFRFLLRDALPDLTSDEWEVILNVYTGCHFPAHTVPARIASDMMDEIGSVDVALVEEKAPDYAALVRKTYAMSQIEQLAILYFVQIFWSNDWKMSEWEQVVNEIKQKF